MLHPPRHYSWCILHRSYISRVTIDSLDVSLSLFGTTDCSRSSSTCCFLTCIQIFQEAGKVVWYSHFLNCDPHTQGFSQWNRSRCFFLEFSCILYNLTDVGNLISGSSAFSKSILNLWKLWVHVQLKHSLENFEHYFTSMWDECNYAVVWAFFGIAFLRDWNENWPFPVL